MKAKAEYTYYCMCLNSIDNFVMKNQLLAIVITTKVTTSDHTDCIILASFIAENNLLKGAGP